MKHPNLVGVDVSESSIKVLQLDADNNIVAYGSAPLPAGVVKDGSIAKQEAFSETLNNVLKNTKPSILHTEDASLRAILCLPESKLFSHHCTIPDGIKDSELESYILEDAKKIIPLEIDSLYFRYHVAEENGVRNATFVGVRKTDLENYVDAFTYANVKPEFIRGELFALGRSLLPEPPFEEDYIILDIGALSTTIGIFSVDSVPNASILVREGGEHFTQHLSMQLEVSHQEANELKHMYGVDPAHEDTRVPGILRERLLPIVDKLSVAKKYFEKKTGNPINHIFLTGGSALTPHLGEYISEKVGIDVSIADPFLKIKDNEQFYGDVNKIFFANVIGLALCAMGDNLADINLLTQYRQDRKESNKESLSVRDIRSISDLTFVSKSLLRKIAALIMPASVMTKLTSIKTQLNWKLLLTVMFLVGAGVLLFWVLATYL